MSEEVKKSSSDILADILLRRELKEEQAKLDNEDKIAAKDVKRKREDAEKLARQNRQFAMCDHLQGNHRPGEAPFRELSHLSLHTFGGPTDLDRRRIRCNKCGFKVWPGDTLEYLYQRDSTGRKLLGKDGQPIRVSNPTAEGLGPLGWKEAYRQVMKGKASGNKPSTGFMEVQTIAPQFEEV